MDYKKIDIKEHFSSREAGAISGFSSYMVDYLCRQKLVIPSAQGSRGRGRGKGRRYSIGDVIQLVALKELIDRGVSVQRLKSSHKNWNKHFSAAVQGRRPTEFLVTDGKNVFLRTKEDLIVDIEKGPQYAFSFLIDLAHLYDKVQAEI